jgi:uncharacterized repeat protein (TIGR01451 family)
MSGAVTRISTERWRTRGAALTLLLLSGCAIDVDLSSSPTAAAVGQPVTFDIAVRNRTTCPVGGVIAVLVPFVPRNLLINRIDDPNVRQVLSALVDAFCSGADVQPPDGSGSCRIENGELICDIVPGMSMSGPLPETAVAMTQSGDEVMCGSDGTRITCRFPHSVVDAARAQQATSGTSLGGLQCANNDTLAVCGALLLDANETKTAQVQFDVSRVGVLHNWVVSVPTVSGGVCTAGLVRRRPCSDDSDCTGMSNTCGSGICVGGTRDGFGCDTSPSCPGGGTCETCDVSNDGQVLSGVACTTTDAATAAAAPAASPWGLATMLIGLAGIGGIALRRLARR